MPVHRLARPLRNTESRLGWRNNGRQPRMESVRLGPWTNGREFMVVSDVEVCVRDGCHVTVPPVRIREAAPVDPA